VRTTLQGQPYGDRGNDDLATKGSSMSDNAAGAGSGNDHRTAQDKAQHPAFVALGEKRSSDVQLRVADAITRFAGSMRFVYLHAALFTIWMLWLEESPWPTLTLAVSLEAIFLSTFVMIGQNRQAAYQQAKADHDFVVGERELDTNTDLTRQIHQLTTELHAQLLPTSVETHDLQDAGAHPRRNP
jgi:uncharacterized membrane protein